MHGSFQFGPTKSVLFIRARVYLGGCVGDPHDAQLVAMYVCMRVCVRVLATSYTVGML